MKAKDANENYIIGKALKLFDTCFGHDWDLGKIVIPELCGFQECLNLVFIFENFVKLSSRRLICKFR